VYTGSCSVAPGGEVDYALRVSFDLPSSRIQGVASIRVKAGRELTVQRGTLRLTDVQLSGRNLPIEPQRDTFRILPPRDGTLDISFEGIFKPPVRPATQAMPAMQAMIDDRK
jgi:hypothetical protein